MRVHPLLDGRDVGERSALTYLDALERELAALNAAAGATTASRRAAAAWSRPWTATTPNWAVVERGWKAHVLGVGRQFASAREAVETYYREDPTSDGPVPRQLRHRRATASRSARSRTATR